MDYKSIIMAQAFGGGGGGGVTVERFVFEGTLDDLGIKNLDDFTRFNELTVKYTGTDNQFAELEVDATALGYGVMKIAGDTKSAAAEYGIYCSTFNVPDSISGLTGASILMNVKSGAVGRYSCIASTGKCTASMISGGTLTNLEPYVKAIPAKLTFTFIVD